MTTEYTNTTDPDLLVVVRHAESMRNKAKKGSTYFADDEARACVKGIPDHKIPLTEDGVAHARRTGIALRNRFGPFDFIYTSGYLRTDQTRDGIVDAYTPDEQAGMQFRIHTFLRERDPGYTYDMTTAEAEAAFPYLAEYWKTHGGFMAAPPGGESLLKMLERVYLLRNEIRHKRPGRKILWVTHGGTIRCIRAVYEQWSYDQAEKWPPGQSPKNCGVTVYKYDPIRRKMVLQEYNTVYP